MGFTQSICGHPGIRAGASRRGWRRQSAERDPCPDVESDTRSLRRRPGVGRHHPPRRHGRTTSTDGALVLLSGTHREPVGFAAKLKTRIPGRLPVYLHDNRRAQLAADATSQTVHYLPSQILEFQVFLHTVMAPLTSHTRLFDSAERRGCVGDDAPVESHHSRLDRLGHPEPAIDVLRVHVGDQTMFGVVRRHDGLLLGLERDHRRHRPENLTAEDHRVRSNVRQDGRLVEVPGSCRRPPAGKNGGVAIDRSGYQGFDLLDRLGIDHRAHLVGPVDPGPYP